MTTLKESGIAQAIAAAGGQVKLAETMGVTQQFISRCLARGYVPLDRAREIEAVYGIPRALLIDPRIRDAVDLPGDDL